MCTHEVSAVYDFLSGIVTDIGPSRKFLEAMMAANGKLAAFGAVQQVQPPVHLNACVLLDSVSCEKDWHAQRSRNNCACIYMAATQHAPAFLFSGFQASHGQESAEQEPADHPEICEETGREYQAPAAAGVAS